MTNKTMDVMRGVIRARLKEMRISAREASRRAGFNVGYIGDFLEGRSKGPESDRLEKIARALEIPVSQLMVPNGSASVATKLTDNSIPLAAERNLIPLYAGKIDMHHAFTPIPDSPVGFVPILPALELVKNAYAVTVFNDFNAPRYFVGETVYVSPEATIQPGDFCFGKRKDGFGSIARIVDLGRKGIAWEWLNPSGADKKINETDLADIVFYHRIVGSVG